MSRLQSAKALSPIAAGALVGLACVLLIHRYPGINHDSSLYLAQALYQRWPDIFGADLFFAHGSQNSYTIMPLLVGKLFAWFPPPAVFLAGTLVSLLVFAAGAWCFVGAVFSGGQRYWAWLGVLCLPTAYGVVSIFSYGEPFLTPRPLAEGLGLLGLGLVARQRWGWATACLVGAGLLHPLQAIAAVVVGWCWLVLHDRRWLHTVWLTLPALLLGLTELRPFDDLYRRMDPEWLANVSGFTRQLFLGGWGAEDWSNLGFDVLALAYAMTTFAGRARAWCMAALAGLGLGLLANLLLVDLLQLVLPAGLQLWRTHWLAHLVANAAIGAVLYRDLARRDIARALCLSLLVLLASTGIDWWALGLFAALYGGWPRLVSRLTPATRRLLALLFVSGMLASLAIYVADEWLHFRVAHYRLELYAFDRRMLAFPLLALGLPALGALAWEAWALRGRSLLLVALALALGIGALRWDARPPFALAIERNAGRPDLFGPLLPDDAQVFWVGDLYSAPWIALRRADYFSTRQLAGVVFNEGTAIEGRARMERVRPVIEEDMYCQDRSVPLQIRESCRISSESLRSACAPGTPRPPDYLVLPYRQAVTADGSWTILDPATGEAAVTFWLHNCKHVMDASHDKP